MGIIRPATPGFLVTLAAAGLLGVVTFSVPYFKSVYFLKASLANEGQTGSVIFGTLGYCMELANGTTCSKPTVGYSLDVNALVGDNTPVKIPNVVVKWITYALVLHVVALILAAASALFGLLAHVREFSMTCCSTCFSGAAAAVALLAFIFDLAFFFIAKSRINAVKGGSASMGIGIWLTLAAWVLLFFAGCFYGFGRCCIQRRPRDRAKDAPAVDNSYAEQMRMDAIRAEADRKARQAKNENGLPAFAPTFAAETQPLTSKLDHEEYVEDGDQIVPFSSYQAKPASPAGGAGVGAGTAAYARQGTSPPARQYAGGYAQAPPGNRAMDDYYNNQPQRTAYPPQPQGPRRQMSAQTTASQYSQPQAAYNNAPPPPMPTVPSSQYLATGAPYGGHSQYPTSASQEYGHPEPDTSFHSATSHQQYPSNYSAQYPEPADTFNSETYNTTGYMQAGQTASPPSNAALYAAISTPYSGAPTPYAPSSTPYNAAAVYAPERGYTLSGDNYPTQPSPPQQHQDYAQSQHTASSYMPSPYSPMPSPAPSRSSSAAPSAAVNRAQSMHKPPLDLPAAQGYAASGAGTSQQQQRATQQPLYQQPIYEDSPPVYDDATAQPAGQWNSKR